MKEANPNLVSRNMDFEDNHSNDKDAKIPVQDEVGKIIYSDTFCSKSA